MIRVFKVWVLLISSVSFVVAACTEQIEFQSTRIKAFPESEAVFAFCPSFNDDSLYASKFEKVDSHIESKIEAFTIFNRYGQEQNFYLNSLLFKDKIDPVLNSDDKSVNTELNVDCIESFFR